MYTLRHKHITKLADSRICQHAFDVKLKKCNSCREQSGGTANCCYDIQRQWSHFKQWVCTCNKIDTSRNHCGRMDQCTNGRRTFHRIRQPHVERQLRRLGCTRDKEQETDDCHRPGSRNMAENVQESQRRIMA